MSPEIMSNRESEVGEVKSFVEFEEKLRKLVFIQLSKVNSAYCAQIVDNNVKDEPKHQTKISLNGIGSI